MPRARHPHYAAVPVLGSVRARAIRERRANEVSIMASGYGRRVYTVAALAEEIGKSPAYVEDLVRNNYIAAKKVGRTTIILAEAFDDYLETLPDA